MLLEERQGELLLAFAAAHEERQGELLLAFAAAHSWQVRWGGTGVGSGRRDNCVRMIVWTGVGSGRRDERVEEGNSLQTGCLLHQVTEPAKLMSRVGQGTQLW